ncbi:hypothetical protein SynBIOSE41_02716 [Synechococcus sp. BIOS-E4-1]|nr:hypothetical protein SynBIOSE41_02716 [Synechococcus sp. BIOS-E4-1]
MKLLLSTSFVIAAISQFAKVSANDVQIGGKPREEYGYFEVDQPEKYVFSYARVVGSKTAFGVGVTTPTQTMADNGLLVPTALFVDCKNLRASFNLMQELPDENAEKWSMETMTYQATFFWQIHKKFLKHSYW